MVQKGGYVGYRRIDGGGTWIARWRTDEGKHEYSALRLPLMAPKLEFDAAQKAARAWFKEKIAGVSSHWRVSDAAKHYIQDRRLNKGQRAADDAEGRINRCILTTLGKKYLDGIRTTDIEEWLNALVANVEDEQQRAAKASANRNLTTLKAMLNKAWRSGRVASNEAWKRVSAFQNTQHAREEFLSVDDRRALYECCTGPFRDLVQAAMLTGARYGELCSLRVGDYDRARRILSIRQGKTGPRDIPVSSEVDRLFIRLSENKLPSAFLLTKDHGVPWKPKDQILRMAKAVKGAKLPSAVVFYTLRHTFIASALTGGLGIHQVAKLCGTSVKMIEAHYDKFLHSDAQERLNKISFM